MGFKKKLSGPNHVGNSTNKYLRRIFIAQIKEFHPDVYKGTEDADAITQLILRAYEVSSFKWLSFLT